MEKIRILGIAPYEGMKISLMEIAAQREDVEITVRVGDLEKGVEIAKSVPPGAYDVILSRGGTAELIRAVTGLPTVEITLSVYDLLRALRLVQNVTERHAIVGFPSITNAAYLLRDLMQSGIEIISIHNSEEAERALGELKNSGYQMIIGDMITSSMAKQAGLNSVLVTSGAESIESALDLAVRQCLFGQELKRQNRLLAEVIKTQGIQAVVFDQRENVVLNTMDQQDREMDLSLKKELPQLAEKKKFSFLKKNRDKNRKYLVEARLIPAKEGEGHYGAFFFEREPSTDMPGIEYVDGKKAEARYLHSFYIAGLQSKDIERQIERYQTTDLPLLLIGEEGTGRDSLAYALYLKSGRKSNPLLVVDCANLQEKGWRFLLSYNHSPLNGEDWVIYFQNCERIPPVCEKQLEELMENTGLIRRNKMLFSFTQRPETPLHNQLYLYLSSKLTCLKIALPPLREAMNEIHNLISLCISSLNMSLGRQAIGMDEDAIRLIREFPWPENYSQLRRIISEAMLLTEGYTISEKTIRKLLSMELPAAYGFGQDGGLLAPGLTLHEIERNVVRIVTAQEDGNQSRAAKRLGISRSTLWRMLKG